MSDTSTGTAVVKCKKGCGKVSVVLTDEVTNEPIKNATVVIRKRAMIGKSTLAVTLTTDKDGKATAELTAGKYKLLARAPGGGSQAPKVPYAETPREQAKKVEVKKSVDNDFTITLRKVPRCALTFALKWKDHDGAGRAFPLDMNVDLVMAGDGNSVIECKVGAGGVLVRRAGTDPLDFLQARGPAKVRVPAASAARFLSCEKKGDPVVEATLVGEGDLAGLGDKRFFELPKAAFDLGVGAWAVTGDGGAYRTSTKDLVTTQDTIGTTSAPTTATFTPDWPCRPFVTLQWKDPEGTARPFPLDLHVDLLLTTPTDSKVEAKVGADGLLVARTGTAPLHFGQSRGPVKVKVAAATEDRYVVVEGRGVTPAEAPALVLKSGLGALPMSKRTFLLPRAAFGLELGRWTVADHETTYEEAEKRFTTADKASIGTSARSAKLVLAPVWQFARLVYQDRFAGGDDQVSVLPVYLEGYAGAAVVETDLKARSNWTIGASAEAAIQCLPWILLADATKPDKDNLLRFTADANTFIETEVSSATPKPRKVVVGARNTPDPERVRFYDLPTEWRSTNWFVRTSAKTLDKAGGKFFFELDTAAKAQATKEAPLVLSLDDIVLYKDANDPLPVLAATTPVAVFKNTFGKGTPSDANVSDLGLFRSTTAMTLTGTQTAEDAYYPCSEGRVLIRGGSTGYTALLENYIVEYPSWTRLVVAGATLFDCFADRTKKKDGEVRVVGARAAVRWTDPVAPTNGLSEGGATGTNDVPLPGRYFGANNRLAPARRTFGVAQLLVGVETPINNQRRDVATSGTKGTAYPGTVTDLGGLITSRVARDPERAKEWQTSTTSSGVIGRWDLCLLRCCGREDDGTEQAVLFQLHRMSYIFAPAPTPPATTPLASTKTTAGAKGSFIVSAIDGLHTRWNGPDGIYNAGRAKIEPVTPTSAPGKLRIETFRLFQKVPDARAAIRATVVGDQDGARDFMDSAGGLTQTQEKNVVPSTEGGVGWFTAAHEMGHGGGLLDDYCELWNHCSYNQPGVVPLVPADPYMFDDTDGRESMMKANKVVRPRHFWHLAEWAHAVLGGEQLQVKHGTVTYKLPHHPSATSGNLPKLRSYLTFAYDSVLDAGVRAGSPLTDKKSRCDLYLYALGPDVYASTVLPDRAELPTGAFDAIIVVIVHLGVKIRDGADHDQISQYATTIISAIKRRFGFRCMADLTCGGQNFKKALICISPRVLMATRPTNGNASYLTTIGASTTTWTASMAVDPGTVIMAGGRAYKASWKSDAGVGLTWLASSTQPTWPTTGFVDEGQIRWTHVGDTQAAGDAAAHDGACERRAKQNQLHAVLEIGTTASEVTEPAGELPRIRVQVTDLSALRDAVSTFARTVKTVYANIKLDRDALHAPPTSPATYTSKVDEARVARDTKAQERTTTHGATRTDTNGAQWDIITGEIATLTTALEGWEKAKALHDDWMGLHSNTQASIVGRAPAMFGGLFAATTNPLTDSTYTLLTGLPGKAATASTQASPTKAKVGIAVDLTTDERNGMSPSNALTANLAISPVRLAVSDLPATARPADAAALVRDMVALATAIRTFADAGADDPGKKARADQAKAAVKDLCDALVARKTSRMNDFASKIPGTYSEQLVQEWLVRTDDLVWVVDNKGREQQAQTIEEKLEQQFAAFLGLEVAANDKGYGAFVTPFADASTTPTISTCKPAPPPPTTSSPPPTPPTTTTITT